MEHSTDTIERKRELYLMASEAEERIRTGNRQQFQTMLDTHSSLIAELRYTGRSAVVTASLA